MIVYMMWIGAVIARISIASKHPVAIAVVVAVVVAVFELSKHDQQREENKKQHNLWAWGINNTSSQQIQQVACLSPWQRKFQSVTGLDSWSMLIGFSYVFVAIPCLGIP